MHVTGSVSEWDLFKLQLTKRLVLGVHAMSPHCCLCTAGWSRDSKESLPQSCVFLDRCASTYMAVPLTKYDKLSHIEWLKAYPECVGREVLQFLWNTKLSVFFKVRPNLIPIWKILVRIKPLIGLNVHPNHVLFGAQSVYKEQPSLTTLPMSQLPHMPYFSILSILYVYLLLYIWNYFTTWAVVIHIYPRSCLNPLA